MILYQLLNQAALRIKFAQQRLFYRVKYISHSNVETHDEVEDILNWLKQYFSVVNINVELALNGVMD